MTPRDEVHTSGRLVMASDAPRIPHCAHWEEGDGECHRCGLANWCTDLGEDDPESHHRYYDAPSCRSDEELWQDV